MRNLEKQELMQVNGGISKLLKYGIMGILAGCTFIASVIYGYIHPVKC